MNYVDLTYNRHFFTKEVTWLPTPDHTATKVSLARIARQKEIDASIAGAAKRRIAITTGVTRTNSACAWR